MYKKLEVYFKVLLTLFNIFLLSTHAQRKTLKHSIPVIIPLFSSFGNVAFFFHSYFVLKKDASVTRFGEFFNCRGEMVNTLLRFDKKLAIF